MKRFHLTGKRLSYLVMIFFFCLLFLFPEASVIGAKNGLFLWFYQVIPSLLPFFILTNLFLFTGVSHLLAGFLSPLLSPFFRCSPAGCYAIVIGVLAGLPLGAKTVASLVQMRLITSSEGEYLLPMSNHVGPLFCLGYISCTVLGTPKVGFLFYAIVVLTPMLIGRLCYRNISFSPSLSRKAGISQKFSFSLLDQSIEQSFSTLFRIGGYIVLFSVLSSLSSLLPIAALPSSVFCSLLEISTGVSSLSALSLPKELLIVLTTGFVTFGGLSSFAQTKSVLAGSNLRLTHYILVKMISAPAAALLMWLFLSLTSVTM